MPILFVKLSTDEDVVAEVEDSGENLVFTNPARLVVSHQGIGMAPFNPFIKDKKITMPKKFVVYTGTPDEEIVSAYNSKFGSGLVIASGNSNILKL